MIHICLYLFLFIFSFIPSGAIAENPDDFLHFSKKSEEALVVHVNDSDLITLEDGRRIHLIGIESQGKPPRQRLFYDKEGKLIETEPEPTISLEEQAIVFTDELLNGKKVRLEFDVEATDRLGRREAYVFLSDGKLANTEILRQGFANLRIHPPNIKYAQQLREAYQEAKREQRGIMAN